MFLLNLFEDLKLDVQDAIIEHNLKKNINNYNKAVISSNNTKVANMDLSDKIGETCRVTNEIFNSDDRHNVFEAYANYLYLLLSDKEMHDFVQKLINAAVNNFESCVALLNIFFDEEISLVVTATLIDKDFAAAFDFIVPVSFAESYTDSSPINCCLSYEEEKKIDDQLEMEQKLEEENESPAEDASESKTEIVSETSTHEEIDPEPVKGEMIDNKTAEVESVKEVEVKVVEEPKLTEPDFVKDTEYVANVTDDANTSKNYTPNKAVHTETYGMIMDNINKDAADMANKVLSKVTEGIASNPEPPKATNRRNTSRKKK